MNGDIKVYFDRVPWRDEYALVMVRRRGDQREAAIVGSDGALEWTAISDLSTQGAPVVARFSGFDEAPALIEALQRTEPGHLETVKEVLARAEARVDRIIDKALDQ